MSSPRSPSLATVRICVLQLPALLRRGGEPPAGAAPAAVAALVLEKKQMQMRRIEEALCRTLELLRKRSPADISTPLCHTFHDGLNLPATGNSFAASPNNSLKTAAASPQQSSDASSSLVAATSGISPNVAKQCFNAAAYLERLPVVAAPSATTETPFDLLVLPEMWSSPYHSSCFSKYAEELPACVSGGEVCDSEQSRLRLDNGTREATISPAAQPGQTGSGVSVREFFDSAEQRLDQQVSSAAALSTMASAGGCAPYGAGVPGADDSIAALNGSAEDTSMVETKSPAFAFMQALARRLRVFVVGGSLVEKLPGPEDQQQQVNAAISATTARSGSTSATETAHTRYQLYNTCCVFDRAGRFISKYRKSHLFDVNILKEEDPAGRGMVFKESAILSAGKELGCFSMPPFGNIGLGICYDLRFPEYALALAQQRQCTLLCYPGAFNKTTGPSHWSLLLRARALDNEVYVVGCSAASPGGAESAPRVTTAAADDAEKQTGPSSEENKEKLAGQNNLAGEYPCYGHSMVVGPWGEVAAQLSGEPGVIVVTAAAQRVRLVRQQIPIYQQKRFNELYTQVSEVAPASVANSE